MAAALQRDAPPWLSEHMETVASGRGRGDMPAGGRGAGAYLSWRPQDKKRRAVAGCSKVETAAFRKPQWRLDGAGHHGGPGIGAQHLLQRPQRLLIGARLDENEPARIEAGLVETTAVRPSEMSERAAGDDQDGGAGSREQTPRYRVGV